MANQTAVTDFAVAARFWSKVLVRRPGVCWPWRGAKHNHGYGVFKVSREAGLVKAHRFAWELANGPIPEGLVVRHQCDNPPCCNPAHLTTGTQADNIADMHARGRREYKSRLTTANVASIFNEYAAGATQQQIAERFGVAPSYISMLISGRRGRAIMKGAPRG